MNRFNDLIEKLKERIPEQDKSARTTVPAGKSIHPSKDKRSEQQFRLPYSSDPEPIEARWK